MDRYTVLDAHVSSCTLGVVGPSGKRLVPVAEVRWHSSTALPHATYAARGPRFASRSAALLLLEIALLFRRRRALRCGRIRALGVQRTSATRY